MLRGRGSRMTVNQLRRESMITIISLIRLLLHGGLILVLFPIVHQHQYQHLHPFLFVLGTVPFGVKWRDYTDRHPTLLPARPSPRNQIQAWPVRAQLHGTTRSSTQLEQVVTRLPRMGHAAALIQLNSGMREAIMAAADIGAATV